MRSSSSSSSSSVFVTSSASLLCSSDWTCSKPWPNRSSPTSTSLVPQASPSSFSTKSKTPSFPSPPSPPPSSSAAAESFKLQGNDAFKAGDFNAAVSFYDEALSLLPRDIPLLSNRAAALASLSRHADTLASCTAALSLCSHQLPPPPSALVAKIYRRKAYAHLKLRQLAAAHGAYKHAQEKEKDMETERLLKKLESESSDLMFSYAHQFYQCRQEIEARWRGFGNRTVERIERIEPIDLVETSRDVFDPSMRQRDLSGVVVKDIASLKEVGNAAIPIFSAFLTNVLTALGLPIGYLHISDLKGADRAQEKARDDYSNREHGPGLSWLFDMVRGSVICERPEEVEKVVLHLVASGFVVRMKNRFATPTPGGFRDFNLNIRVRVKRGDGNHDVRHICELQVHVKALKDFGKEIGSHDVYDFFRKYFSGGTKAVEERLQIMDDLFGGRLEGIGSGPTNKGQSMGKRATSLEEVVEQVCAEGDVFRMDAAIKLVDTLCEHKLAEKLLREMVERCKGSENLPAAHAMNNLAISLNKQGKYEEGAAMFCKALESKIRLLGPDHESTLDTMHNLANVQQNMGQYHESLATFEKVHAGLVRLLGPDAVSTLGTLHGIGNLQLDLGKYGEAFATFEKAHTGFARVLGSDHKSSLDTLLGLGSSLMKAGRLDEALATFQKVLAAQIRRVGPDHTDTLLAIINIGNTQAELGIYREAQEMLQKAVSGYSRLLGEDHLSTLSAMSSLGDVLDDLGKHDDALEMLQKVHARQSRVLGPENLTTLKTLGNVGVVLGHLGRREEELSTYQKALAGEMKVFGPNHPSTLNTINNIGSSLNQLGRYGEALETCQKSLDVQIRVQGPNHSNTLMTMMTISVALENLGRLKEALAMAEKIVVGFSRTMGAQHPYSRNADRLRARLLSKLASSRR